MPTRCLDTNRIDVVLLDLRLPGTGGLEVLREIKRRRPETVVIVMTGYASVQSAVQAMKQGAYDYVTKPFNLEELRLILERVLAPPAALHRKPHAARAGEEQGRLRGAHRPFAGDGKALSHHLQGGAQLASGADPGRERHRQGAGGALDSLLRPLSRQAVRGHRLRLAGADADRERAVRLRARAPLPAPCGPRTVCWPAADGGTIFLDEIGELPIDLQAKLLRALQEKEVRPVGGTSAVPIDVRVLAATNRDLEHAVPQGTFRKDLYFRLNVLTLRIPPLRQRKQDIPLLVGHFLERLRAHRGAAQHQRRRAEADAELRLAGQHPRAGELHRARLRDLLAPTIHIADLPTQLPQLPGAGRAETPAPIRWPSSRSPSWKSRPSCTPSRCCTATSWKPRGGWASAKPLCTANSKNTARRSDRRAVTVGTTDGRTVRHS